MRVVKIQQQRMLCGSNYDGITPPVQTYNDDEEVIDRSFLSDSLKHSYWLSYNYRRATLSFAK